MHGQGNGDDAIGHEDTEILAQLGVIKQLFAGLRRDNEEGVEEDYAYDSLFAGSFFHRSPAHQQRGNGILANLGMGAIGGKGADILQVNQLSPAGQSGRDNHGDYPGCVHIDAGGVGDSLTLSHSAHILAQSSP